MYKTIIAIAIAFTACTAMPANLSGSINAVVGHKSLDNDDNNGFKSQSGVGIISDFKMNEWPFSIAIDFFTFADSEDDVFNNNNDRIGIIAVTTQLHAGLRNIWHIEGTHFSPYAGGGMYWQPI